MACETVMADSKQSLISTSAKALQRAQLLQRHHLQEKHYNQKQCQRIWPLRLYPAHCVLDCVLAYMHKRTRQSDQ